MALLTPKRSAQLSGFFGANAKIGNDIYPSIDAHVSMIKYLGIQYLRVGIVTGTIENMKYLYEQTGVKFILLTSNKGEGTDPLSILNTIRAIGPEKIIGVENPNEPDLFGLDYKGQSWPESVTTFARDLWNTLRSSNVEDAIKKIPIVGTSLPYYGTKDINISAYVDLSNTHPYASDTRPEEVNQYGSWKNQVTDGAIAIHGDKPIVVTEYGYYQSVMADADWDFGQKYPISDRANAKYLLRRSLHMFDNKAAMGFFYELRDGDSAQPSEKEAMFGCFATDGTPKKSAAALKSLITATKDTAANALTFTPQPLEVVFSGDTTELNYSFVQKADGKYILAVWRSLFSYQYGATPDARYDLSPAATNLSIKLASTPKGIRKIDTLTSTTAVLSPSALLEVALADSVVLLEVDMTPVATISPSTASPIVTIYEHDQFNGRKMEFNAVGSYNLTGDRIGFNDMLSSLKVQKGYKVTLYAHHNQLGSSKVFQAGDHSYVGNDFNDMATTVLIEKVS